MFTIANVISLFRIFLSFLFLNYWFQGLYKICLFVFVFASLSDFADGFIARYFNQESKLGSFLDPFADKIMFIFCYYALFFDGFLPSWFIVFSCVKELILIIFGLCLFLFSSKKVEVIFLSKLNTFIQILLIIFVLLKLSGLEYLNEFNFVFDLTIYFSFFLSTLSIFLYSRKYSIL